VGKSGRAIFHIILAFYMSTPVHESIIGSNDVNAILDAILVGPDQLTENQQNTCYLKPYSALRAIFSAVKSGV
jgi:hypothetical protein